MSDSPLDIPAFLKISPEDRAQAWRDNPPQGTKPNLPGLSPLQVEHKELARRRKADKARGSKARRIALTNYNASAVKAGTLRWDPRFGRWVKDGGGS